MAREWEFEVAKALGEEIDRPAHQFTAIDYIAIATITEALFSYLRNA